MSSAIVRSAMRTELAARFPMVPVRDIENLNVDPVVDSQGRAAAFMGLLFFGTEQANGIGVPNARQWREQGTVDVVIFYPAGRGIDTAAEMADTIRGVFGGREIPVEAPGKRLVLLTADPLSSYLSRPGVPVGTYFVSMVALSYEFDFIR